MTDSRDLNAVQPTGRGQSGPGAHSARGRLVTDLTTRALHAAMALSFGVAYLTAESEWWRLWHVAMGYVFVGAAAMRLLYGLLGPRHAQAQLWWRRGQAASRWMFEGLRPARGLSDWLAKTPLMLVYATIVGLLLAVLPITISGLMVHEDWGPYVLVDVMAELHEWVGEAMLALIVGHIAGVLVHGWLKRSPYWQRMFNGRSPERGPDVRDGLQALWLGLSAALLAWFAWSVGSGAWVL